MTRAWLAASLVAVALGCGARQSPNGVTADDAIVYIKSNVRDAQVYIDGRLVAPLNGVGRGLALEPGVHRLELRHEEYFSSYLELSLARAERKTVSVPMAPILP